MTGLDSAVAINVMRIVRRLADQGQSVICTIHQPPAQAYAYFTKMLLLQVGGTLAYFGPCAELNGFYEEVGAGKMLPGRNPADWAIEAIALYDSAEAWNKHGRAGELERTLAKGVCPADFVGESYDSAFATGFLTQFKSTLKRGHRFFWRDHENVWARMIGALVIGIGLYNIKDEATDFKTITFYSVFYVTVVYCSESAAEEVPILVNERPTFYREIDSKFFGVLPYYLSRWMAQQPLLIVQGLFLAIPMFWLTLGSFPQFGMPATAETTQMASGVNRFEDFLLFYVEVFLTLSVSATFSQLFAAASPNEGMGNVLYFTMCCLSRLFSGFIIFLGYMGGIPGSTQYAFVRWVGRLSNMFDFFKYAFFTFGASFINGTTWVGVPDNSEGNAMWRQIVNPYPTTSTWMPNWWLHSTPSCDGLPCEYEPDRQSWIQKYQFIILLLVVIFVFNLITFLLLRCIRHDKR